MDILAFLGFNYRDATVDKTLDQSENCTTLEFVV